MIPMLLSNTELALVISIPASVLVVIGILLILFFNLRKRKKTLIKEEVTPLVDETAYFAFGGKDNIISTETNMSRFKVTLKDVSKANKEGIQKLGAKGIVEIDNQLKIILGSNSKQLKKYIDQIK